MAQKKENIKGSNKIPEKKKVKEIKEAKEETIEMKKVKAAPKKVEVKGKHTPPKKAKIDSTTIQILLGLFVILTLVSFFTMGLITTLVMDVGIILIILISMGLKKLNLSPRKRKVLNIIAIFFLTLCILASVAVGGLLVYVVATAPEFNPDNLRNKESSIIYSASDNEIARLGIELRENVKYEDLPQVFIDALVATEDSRFFQHNGFDAPRFLKATVQQLLGKDDAGGASTLSMQVVKNSYTSTTSKGIQGIIRKFTDIYLSVFKLEKEYSKEKIIEFYVNNHPLGGTVYGVEEAAQTYFGKSIRDVNLAEAATLVGMFKAPTSYNPITHPDNAESRRATVLNLMVRHGYISKEEAEIADSIPVDSLIVRDRMTEDQFEFQAFIDLVLDELNTKYEISFTETPVLIYTTLDEAKQREINAIFDGTSSRYQWINENAQGGVGVVENSTGKLVAVGGGRKRTGKRGFSFATAIRQIGSTAKPLFDYGPGIEYNNWSTYEQFVDEPWSYTSGTSINNSDLSYMGQMSLRTALALSRNIPAVKAFQSLDKNLITNFVTSLGITPDEGYLHEAHALGAFKGASPIQMAGAYAAFASGGYYTEPYTITKIVYRSTGEEVPMKNERTQVMSDATAFMITDCLKTAVNSGISDGAKVDGVVVAAKTGTSSFTDDTKRKYSLPDNAINDAWIVGYDPDYTIGMWYGYEDIEHGYSTNITAVRERSRLFKALGNIVFSKSGKDFVAPESVVQSAVEIGSNPALLPSENTPQDQITYEYFKAGTEPTEVSTRYQRLESVTNLNASYDEKNNKVTLTWNAVSRIPSGNTSYGDFGYNVYFGDTLLGFTTDTKFTFTTADPDGTYSVCSAFQNYNGNQSIPVTVTIKTDKPTSTPGESTGTTYRVSLKGNQYVTLKVGDTFTDTDPPLSIIDSTAKKDIYEEVKKANGITITIQDKDEKTVDKIDTSKANVYTITYTVKYKTINTKVVRTVTIEEKDAE